MVMPTALAQVAGKAGIDAQKQKRAMAAAEAASSVASGDAKSSASGILATVDVSSELVSTVEKVSRHVKTSVEAVKEAQSNALQLPTIAQALQYLIHPESGVERPTMVSAKLQLQSTSNRFRRTVREAACTWACTATGKSSATACWSLPQRDVRCKMQECATARASYCVRQPHSPLGCSQDWY